MEKDDQGNEPLLLSSPTLMRAQATSARSPMAMPARRSRMAILPVFPLAFVLLLGGRPIRAARYENNAGNRQGLSREADKRNTGRGCPSWEASLPASGGCLYGFVKPPASFFGCSARTPAHRSGEVVPGHQPDASWPRATTAVDMPPTALRQTHRPRPAGPHRLPPTRPHRYPPAGFPPVPAGGTYAVATPAAVLRWWGAPTQGPGAAAQSSLSSTRSCSV